MDSLRRIPGHYGIHDRMVFGNDIAVQALFSDSANGRMRRDRLQTIFGTQAIEFFAQDVELGFVYDSSAVVGDGSAAPARPADGQLYTPTSRPGHRLPHCWLDQRGRKLSTHDLSGAKGDFVLLVRSEGAQWRAAVEAAAKGTGVAIRLVVIGRGGDALTPKRAGKNCAAWRRTGPFSFAPTIWWPGGARLNRIKPPPNSPASCKRY